MPGHTETGLSCYLKPSLIVSIKENTITTIPILFLNHHYITSTTMNQFCNCSTLQRNVSDEYICIHNSLDYTTVKNTCTDCAESRNKGQFTSSCILCNTIKVSILEWVHEVAHQPYLQHRPKLVRFSENTEIRNCAPHSNATTALYNYFPRMPNPPLVTLCTQMIKH